MNLLGNINLEVMEVVEEEGQEKEEYISKLLYILHLPFLLQIFSLELNLPKQ